MRGLMLFLAIGLATIASERCFAADEELDALAADDRAVMRQLLTIDAKLSWNRESGERVVHVLFSSSGATSEALALLPKLPALLTLGLPAAADARKPAQMGPLAECLALRELHLEIPRQADAEWSSLPVLDQVTRVVITDHTGGRVEIYGRFPQAVDIVLWSHGLKQFDCEQLRHLSQLKSFSLRVLDSPWTGAGLANLKKCKSLEGLGIGGDELTDVALKEISDIPLIKKLSLSSGKFTREGFAQLTRLESFRCSGRWFTDELATGLSDCRDLKNLDLSGTAVTGNCFEALAKLPLEEVTCPGLKTENLHWFKDCKTLRRLELSVRTREDRKLQQDVSHRWFPNVELVQQWHGEKGDDPKSGK